MVQRTIFLMILIGLSINVLAKTPTDSTARATYQKLADRLRLRKPKLQEDEYEVRIWNRQGLMFGTAQMLYVLTKKKKSLTVHKYIIESDKNGFRRAVQLNLPHPVPVDLWEQLLHDNILTLPDQQAINNQLHPRPPKDSTWTGIESDGSVSVHAKKIENSVWITDGEGYYFEVFNEDKYRSYGYSNPRGYIRYKPNIAELQHVVAILDSMAILFRSSTSL